MSWYVWAKLAFLAWALISLIIYAIRRADDRNALETLRTQPVLRTLSEEELAALAPLQQAQKLHFKPDVRRIRGRYRQHGLSANGSSTTHDTIDDVTVLLPYDAEAFLAEDNEAEVVISGNVAVVVKLNGFEVVDGYRRALRATPPTGTETTPEEAPVVLTTTASDAPVTPATTVAAATEPEWLGQRDETTVEAQLRLPRQWRSATVWCCVLAVFLLWLATCAFGRPVQLLFLVAGLACITVAIVRAVRRTPPVVPAVRRIDRARGRLAEFAMKAANNASLTQRHTFLGSNLQVQLPRHWQKSNRVPYGEDMHIEVDRLNGRVLGLGEGWSLAEEHQRFPAPRWGVPLLLTLLGLFGLLLALPDEGSVRNMLTTGMASIIPGTVREDATPQGLLQDRPSPGDVLKVSGEGTCALVSDRTPGQEDIAIADCSQVLWGGTPAHMPFPQVEPALLALYGGEYLRTRPSSRHAALASMLGAMDTLSLSALREVWEVRGLEDLVSLVEDACTTDAPACTDLKTSLVRTLDLQFNGPDGDTALDDWPSLAAQLRKQAAEIPAAFNSIEMSPGDVEAIRTLTRDFASTPLKQALVGQSTPLLEQQRGGVILALDDPVLPTEQIDQRITEAYAVQGRAVPDNLLVQWARSEQLSLQPSPFSLQARVMAAYQDNGSLHLDLMAMDADGASRGVAAIAGSLLLMLSLGLLLGQGYLLVQGLRQALARRTALAQDIARRPPPGQPWRF
jgi:hypothetical protein